MTGGRLGDGRKHLGADAVLHRGAADLMAVAQDVDAEGHGFTWLIGPVSVIRRHGDGHPAEWQARPLRKGRSDNTSQNRTHAEDAPECGV